MLHHFVCVTSFWVCALCTCAGGAGEDAGYVLALTFDADHGRAGRTSLCVWDAAAPLDQVRACVV